jgi:carbonic anhydrase
MFRHSNVDRSARMLNMWRDSVLFFFGSILAINAAHVHEWNYDEYGPDVWSERYPSCAGQSQSPINILTACTSYKNFTPFAFGAGYNEQHNFTLQNNGHTIVGTFHNEEKLAAFRLEGGDLNGTFELVNFHLHWGENHKTGSEHEV